MKYLIRLPRARYNAVLEYLGEAWVTPVHGAHMIRSIVRVLVSYYGAHPIALP